VKNKTIFLITGPAKVVQATYKLSFDKSLIQRQLQVEWK